MKDKRADISQIQAYLKGELDGKAMHQLEREAQADPFLADALDGYAAVADQQDNLAVLQQRLRQRTEPKVRRLLPWTTIAIAASVVGFIIVTGLFFLRNNESKPSAQIAANEVSKPAPLAATPAPLADSSSTITDNKVAETRLVQKQQIYVNNTPAPVKKTFPSLNAPVKDAEAAPAPVVAEADKNAEQAISNNDVVLDYARANRQDTILGGENIAINKKPSAITVLKSKAEGAAYKERGQSAGETATLMAANLPTGLTGKVLDGSGAPLPGASVQVVGKPTATTTDAYGRFNLRKVKPEDQIAYGYIGYDKKVLPAKTGDSVKVTLKESNASLSEVVVVQTASKRIGTKAAPRMGWKAFNDYLKSEATVPDGDKTGAVQVSFTVEPNGDIGDIKVTKSLGPKTDERAIGLIKNYGRWFGNLNGKPEIVKVTVKFARNE